MRKSYKMSMTEYAFRTKGGNLSRTSLYGTGDLRLTKTKHFLLTLSLIMKISEKF